MHFHASTSQVGHGEGSNVQMEHTIKILSCLLGDVGQVTQNYNNC